MEKDFSRRHGVQTHYVSAARMMKRIAVWKRVSDSIEKNLTIMGEDERKSKPRYLIISDHSRNVKAKLSRSIRLWGKGGASQASRSRGIAPDIRKVAYELRVFFVE